MQSEETTITSVSLAGTFNDWQVSANPMDLQRDGSWTTTITIDVPGAIEFKFAANGSWKLSAGEMDQEADSLPLAGTAEITDGSGNITAFIPRIGDYVFTINPADYRYTVTPAEVPQLDDQSE